jgi:hypothetical protein
MQPRHTPDASERVMAEPFVGVRRNPRTYRPDRVCAAPGCRTRLSIYNSTPVCAEHNPHRGRTRRSRGRSPESPETNEGPGALRAEAS